MLCNRHHRMRTAVRILLYFAKDGRYVASGHTPLAWTQANQALALYLMEKSLGEKR
jgi:hypothetical protein